MEEKRKLRYFIVAYSVPTISGMYIGSVTLSCERFPSCSGIQNSVVDLLTKQNIKTTGKVIVNNIQELDEQDFNDYMDGYTL